MAKCSFCVDAGTTAEDRVATPTMNRGSHPPLPEGPFDAANRLKLQACGLRWGRAMLRRALLAASLAGGDRDALLDGRERSTRDPRPRSFCA